MSTIPDNTLLSFQTTLTHLKDDFLESRRSDLQQLLQHRRQVRQERPQARSRREFRQ